LGRLSQALTDLGARIRTEGVPEGLPFSHGAASLAGVGIWNLTCEFGEFDISFIGDNLDTEAIEAKYRDGVLRLTIPIAQKAKPRKIAISHTDQDTAINA
jgi:hypothetical protein